jgi:hypothetical protein
MSGDIFDVFVGSISAWNQIGLFFGGLIMLLIGGVMIADFVWWRVSADQFTGKIIDVLGNGKNFFPVIEYTNKVDTLIRANTNSGSSHLATKYPGRLVKILVKPHDPELARVKGYVWFILGIIFAGPGIVMSFVALTQYEISLYTILIGLGILGYGGFKLSKIIKPKSERESVGEFQSRKRKEQQKKWDNMQSLSEAEIRERIAKQDKANGTMVPIMMLLGLALIGGGYYLGNDLYEMELGGLHAEGIVTGHERVHDTSSDGGGPSYYPVVRFKDELGNEVTFKDRVGSSHPTDKRGDVVEVLYEPQNSDKAIIDRGLWNWLPSLGVGGAGLLLFTVSIRTFRAMGRRARGDYF